VNIVGLDPSLTCTGVVAVGHTDSGHSGVTGAWSIRSQAPTVKDTAEVRADRILEVGRRWVELLDDIHGDGRDPILIVCESRDFQTSTREGGHATDRNWLMGHLLISARSFGALLVFIPPTSLKLYACSDGRASKSAVKTAVERRYGVSLANDDEADALTLAAMGADVYGSPLAPAPEDQRQALRSADWPIIGVTRSGARTVHMVPRIPAATTTRRKRTR